MREDGVAPTTWRVVLCDWYNANAEVTITLKSGVQLTGTVDGHPSKWLHDMASLEARINGRLARHTIDLTEVAAITAKAV